MSYDYKRSFQGENEWRKLHYLMPISHALVMLWARWFCDSLLFELGISLIFHNFKHQSILQQFCAICMSRGTLWTRQHPSYLLQKKTWSTPLSKPMMAHWVSNVIIMAWRKSVHQHALFSGSLRLLLVSIQTNDVLQWHLLQMLFFTLQMLVKCIYCR